MRKRFSTNKKHYLFNMVAFLGFSFEFFIRGDSLLGMVMIFNGLINIVAYQQVPRRVSSITVILNLFNFLISLTACYNYSDIDYVYPFIFWLILSVTYSVAVVRQIYSIISYRRYRNKQKRRMS